MRKTNRKLTVVALLCTTFLAAMEATAVATVMPTIIGDLGGLERYAWVFTAYMMSATLSVPIYGKLADLFGRKPILQAGIGMFLVGSILSALAQNMNQLILFRAIQGIGAGAIQPMGLTITGDIFKIEERAKVTAIFGTVWGIAGISGPLIGSFIVKFFGWPWIFYINIPFGLASAFIIQRALVEHVEKKKVHLDLIGAALLSGTIISTLMAVNDPDSMIFLVPLSTILFVAFLLAEQRAIEPIVPLSLFANPVISNASLVSIMLGGAMLSFVSYLPLYIEGVRGLDVLHAGMCIMPMGLAWPIASGLSARILKHTGFRPLLRLGLLFVLLGSAITGSVAILNGPFQLILVGMTFLGLGMGFSNIPLLFSVQSSVDWHHRGIATASTLFFRTIGGTVAVGIMGGILAKALRSDPMVPISVANDLMGPFHGRNLSFEMLQKLAAILEKALNKVFFSCICIAFVGLIFGLFFPDFKKGKPVG